MKRFAASFALLLSFLGSAVAGEQRIRDIDITVSLNRDGSADIREVWDVCVNSGTEWYLVRKNLGDIRISSFTVSDESGRVFKTLPDWDLDRSLSQKAYTCGINSVRDGCELCWGVGSYGDHVFDVSYTMSNVVKSLSDYDALHLQLVSPGLSAKPEHVRVTVKTPLCQLDTSNARIWGFGFVGEALFEGGRIVYESTERFRSESSVIALIRFDKGIFASTSIRDGSFGDILETALEGSSYNDDETSPGELLAMFATVVIALLSFVLVIRQVFKANGRIKDPKRLEAMYGVRDLGGINWNRSVPFSGDIFETSFIANHLKGGDNGENNFIGAFMLRMVQHSVLVPQRDSRNRTVMYINSGASTDYMSECEKSFFQCLTSAAGTDGILQANEFKRWSARYPERLESIVNSFRREALVRLRNDSMASTACTWRSPQFTLAGQESARNAVGFKKYLEEFTIIDERHPAEVALWNDYLVVASIFGMAEQVSKDMKSLYPEVYQQYVSQTVMADPIDIVIYNRVFSSNFNQAIAQHKAEMASKSARSGGFGGGTSFGGGGGFSGGGFGGGSR